MGSAARHSSARHSAGTHDCRLLAHHACSQAAASCSLRAGCPNKARAGSQVPPGNQGPAGGLTGRPGCQSRPSRLPRTPARWPQSAPRTAQSRGYTRCGRRGGAGGAVCGRQGAKGRAWLSALLPFDSQRLLLPCAAIPLGLHPPASWPAHLTRVSTVGRRQPSDDRSSRNSASYLRQPGGSGRHLRTQPQRQKGQQGTFQEMHNSLHTQLRKHRAQAAPIHHD